MAQDTGQAGKALAGLDGDGAVKVAENMTQAYQLAQEAWAFYLSKQGEMKPGDMDPYNLAPALADLQKSILHRPEVLIDATIDLWQRQATLWTNSIGAMVGAEPVPVKGVTDVNSSRHFDHEDWEENLVFNYLKQSYLLASNWMRDAVQKVDSDLPEAERTKLEFFTERFAEALSPRNMAATNPAVLKATAEEGGANLVRGMRMMLEDMKRGDGELLISQTDMKAFEVGRNIAVTPGAVVYQNDLFQLLQYSPTTENVHEIPVLIAPPWINKFYILDLNEKKSMIRWLVAQGYTVFIMSWRNPQPYGIERDFEDYISEGFYNAIDAVLEETGVKSVNCVGYCIGGTMLSTALAHMATQNDKRIKSATFFTAQADFVKAGELRIFVDDKTLASMEEEAGRTGGVIGAQHMAKAFNMLRGNELIWNYVVNNYYLGKEPPAFDLLYWNADSTRMPAKCHITYLREYYRDNALAEGELKMLGQTLDLGKVKTPIYSICAKEDHIAPAASVYRSVKLYGGPVRLVVGGSGHIAGVVNPPDPKKVKYQYWTNSLAKSKWPEDLSEWLAGAKETPGSWWPDWDAWLSKKSGKQVPAREPGATLGVIEPAPGSYVRVRSDAGSGS